MHPDGLVRFCPNHWEAECRQSELVFSWTITDGAMLSRTLAAFLQYV